MTLQREKIYSPSTQNIRPTVEQGHVINVYIPARTINPFRNGRGEAASEETWRPIGVCGVQRAGLDPRRGLQGTAPPCLRKLYTSWV